MIQVHFTSCFTLSLLFSTLSYDNQSSIGGQSTSVNSAVRLPKEKSLSFKESSDAYFARIEKEKREYLAQFNHKVGSDGLTDWDRELIDLNLSTTYRSCIYDAIRQADTEKCREELRYALNDPQCNWED